MHASASSESSRLTQPLLLPDEAVPPAGEHMARQTLDGAPRRLLRTQSDSYLFDDDGWAYSRSPWQDCFFSRCCEDKPHQPFFLPAAQPSDHAHHQSLTRRGKQVGGDVVSPSIIPTAINLAAPEGQVLAHAAGGAWVSQILERVWPQLAAAVEASLQDLLPQLLLDNKPTWVEEIQVDRFTLGTRPPLVQGVHVDPVSEVDASRLGAVPVRLDVAWDSASDIQLTAKLLPSAVASLVPGLIQSMLSYVTSLTMGVQDLVLRANLLVSLGPLTSVLPIVKAAQISLLATPDLDFNLTVTRGESHILNLIKPWLSSVVASAFSTLIVPDHISIPISAPDMPDVQKPEGLLMVRVVKATGVPKMDYWGHGDPYVITWVRGGVKRKTTVIKDNSDPEWEADQASFQFLINTRQYQTLSLELWDEDDDMLSLHDDLVGGASVRLATLEPGKEHQLKLKVVNASSGVKGKEAPPGIDPAQAGGTSKVDVSDTWLHVVARYIPAAVAHLEGDVIGCPGLFNMKLTKVTVPDLAVLPLKARPHLTGQEHVLEPPLSRSILPMKGRDPETGTDQSTRRDIPVVFEAVWDVLGSAAHVAGSMFYLELIEAAGGVLARVEVPLANIMSRKLPHVSKEVGGGGAYVLQSSNGFEFEMQLLWFPLMSDVAQADSVALKAVADAGVGLQQLLQAGDSSWTDVLTASRASTPIASQGGSQSSGVLPGPGTPEMAVPVAMSTGKEV